MLLQFYDCFNYSFNFQNFSFDFNYDFDIRYSSQMQNRSMKSEVSRNATSTRVEYSSAMVNCSASAACHECSGSSHHMNLSLRHHVKPALKQLHWLPVQQRITYISCVCLRTKCTMDKHHNTSQTVYPQFLQPVTDTGWSRLAQRSTLCLKQEPDLENVVYATHGIAVEILSVRLSVCQTRVLWQNYCEGKRIFSYHTKRQSLCYSDANSGWCTNSLKSALKVTHPLRKTSTSTDFRL